MWIIKTRGSTSVGLVGGWKRISLIWSEKDILFINPEVKASVNTDKAKRQSYKYVQIRHTSKIQHYGQDKHVWVHQRMLALIFSSLARNSSRSRGGLHSLTVSLPCCSRDSRSLDSWDSSISMEEGAPDFVLTAGRLDWSAFSWEKKEGGGDRREKVKSTWSGEREMEQRKGKSERALA